MTEGKPAPKTFSAFFSYAHADAAADPQLLKWFTAELTAQVTPLITKASFKVWNDEGLRKGEFWADRLVQEVRAADVLIVLMTPRWLESNFCRDEFEVFEVAEAERKVGPYVLPLLWRDIDLDKHEFNEEEMAVLQKLQTRQRNKLALAKDFATAPKAKRDKLIKEIAEDIAGMIRQLQKVATQPTPASAEADIPAQQPLDFDLGRVRKMILAGRAPPRDWVPHITELHFGNDELVDLKPLTGLTRLRLLVFGASQVTDLAPLATLTNLRVLSLPRTQASDITPLIGLTNLETLDLEGTPVRDFTPLARLTDLQWLDIQKTQVTELAPLSRLTRLRTLYLQETRINDLTPLAGLVDLESLFLRGTKVASLAPLAGLAGLKSLDLLGTAVSDLAPVAHVAHVIMPNGRTRQ